jgi:hypothetical protein
LEACGAVLALMFLEASLMQIFNFFLDLFLPAFGLARTIVILLNLLMAIL